jgi:hypothetical protein
MTHKTAEIVMDSKAQEFQDLIEHGDDFLKIELLRPAKKYYKKALELNIEPEKIRQKIEECDRLLNFEKRVVRILFVIAVVALTIWALVSN